MTLTLYIAILLAALGLIIGFSYRRWQRITERDRFLLGMKEASQPMNMKSDDKLELKLLRSPWWAVWRWLPDLWRRVPPP